jgi:hypothetical protein
MFFAKIIESVQTVRRGAEGWENGIVEWIGNGIDGRVSKVFWRAEGEQKELRMKTESGNRTESEN